jgi:chitinase
VTVTITVTPVNDPPVAVADSYAGQQGQQLVAAAPGVLDNDTDPEDNPLTAVLATGPAHGTLDLAPDGSFTYTPAAGFSGTDTFTYRASDGSVTSAPATVRLTVQPGQPPAGWSVSDAPAVSEPHGTGKVFAMFTVSLGAPSPAAVTVHAQTQDATAIAGQDYKAVSVDLRFRKGESQKTVKVAIVGDHVVEGQEGFTLVLSKPTGPAVVRGTGAAVILADPPLPGLSVADAVPVAEPAPRTKAYAYFTVTLSAPSFFVVKVHAATVDGTAKGGTDFVPVSVDLRFSPGQVQKTVRIRIMSDKLTEGPESFSLVLSQPTDAVVTRASATEMISGP